MNSARTLDHAAARPPATGAAHPHWRQQLPLLAGNRIVLRELRLGDAPSLCAVLGADEVSRFISPPPRTIAEFEQFIQWALRVREAGDAVCFAVTADAIDLAIGIFQVRRLDAPFALAEWGFALASPFWGTGVFQEGAELVLDFAFRTLGVRRLEARAAMVNGRGIGALRKIGAVQECVLRESFVSGGSRIDQALYAILDVDGAARRAAPSSGFH
jgi:RimJ/RimL family protein N-acetyltransferase